MAPRFSPTRSYPEPPAPGAALPPALRAAQDSFLRDLRRYASYYSSGGYRIGGETRYDHYTDFCFKRGESEVTIEFAKLKSIEFGAKGAVTVSLVSGTCAPGTLSSGRSGIDGFTGINEAGGFFGRPGSVKKIVFSSTKGGK